jgi:glyoxylase-like metal-dependent hydrolase (beta-lactamase superfamily II)
MKMHILSGGRLRMRKSIYLPDADRSETIELPVSSILLRDARGNVLFDTGCHPSVVQDAAGRWGGLAKFIVPIMGPDDNVIAGLAALGLEPDDIDVVVCSHLHPDHCGCNVFFTKATVMVHARELEAARAANAAIMGYVAADWDHPIRTEPVTGERDLYDDGRVVVIPLPGHTPGMLAALVALERTGPVLLASDTVSVRATLDTGILPKNTWNANALTRSLDEVRRIEASGAMIICGHDAAQWATLRKGTDAYD